jgi:hypothetical protein
MLDLKDRSGNQIFGDDNNLTNAIFDNIKEESKIIG